MSDNLVRIEPEYIYVTIPAEYICVYHRILAMLADYGEDMLKDCKASCTDRNSSVIDCFNMFNAAVAARKLGKDKLAETLIKYIKAKINQIYKGKDNSTSFVFPVDEHGDIKAFVSCGERPRFEINSDDMELYEHKFNNGFDEHFRLGPIDESDDGVTPPEDVGLTITFFPRYDKYENGYHPCGELYIWFNRTPIDPKDCIIDYYFDGVEVSKFSDIYPVSIGTHEFMVVVTYNNETKIDKKTLYHGTSD